MALRKLLRKFIPARTIRIKMNKPKHDRSKVAPKPRFARRRRRLS